MSVQTTWWSGPERIATSRAGHS